MFNTQNESCGELNNTCSQLLIALMHRDRQAIVEAV